METPPDVLNICQTLKVAGFQAWLVGGCVRDSLMGRDPHDWDIATDASPEQVQRAFPRTFPTGIEHGTVTVMVNKVGYEVTTFRGDGSYSDGRRPDGVQFLSDIEGDLARRDFTINAIAYDPLQDVFSDPFRGLDDIEAGVLRAVGNPLERFAEDGLRALRAARFTATLGMSLDPATAAALRPSLGSYEKVSSERVRDEWLKIMKAAPKPSQAFGVMLDHGLLGVTAPEFVELVDCKQNRFHEYDVWGHTMAVVDALPRGNPLLRLGGLFHDVGKPATKCFQEATQDFSFYNHDKVGAEMTARIFNRLRFSTQEKETVTHLVRHHMLNYHSDWSDSAVRRWVRKVHPSNLDALFALARADIAGKGNAKAPMDAAVIEELRSRVEALEATAATPTSTQTLAITGKDVMSLGVPQGPGVGRILKDLLEKATDDPSLNERDTLMALARESLEGE